MPEQDADDARLGDLLSGSDFADLIPELQSNRPDDPPDVADPTGGQSVDEPQYDDPDPYPYGVADL
jgi:hypothetical protein